MLLLVIPVSRDPTSPQNLIDDYYTVNWVSYLPLLESFSDFFPLGPHTGVFMTRAVGVCCVFATTLFAFKSHSTPQKLFFSFQSHTGNFRNDESPQWLAAGNP